MLSALLENNFFSESQKRRETAFQGISTKQSNHLLQTGEVEFHVTEWRSKAERILYSMLPKKQLARITLQDGWGWGMVNYFHCFVKK